MTDAKGGPVVILSRSWKESERELSYAIRSVAGAASRHGPVTVLVPGEKGHVEPDGGFDLTCVGTGPGGGWPAVIDTGQVAVPDGAPVIVDELSEGARSVLRALGGSRRLFALSGPDGRAGNGSATTLSVVGHDTDPGFVGLHVPINPLAAAHRHNGLGFVGYVLVLSDRKGTHDGPPDAAAWLTAGFHRANVVVVEDARASVWRGRALRGVTTVDSRTDLWRLVAHARVCIDLAPGDVIARECVEALRYGTPIIVPGDAPAAVAHAAAGGLVFNTMADLLQQVSRCEDDGVRASLSDGGKAYADTTYGDPDAFTDRVCRMLAR